MDVFFDWYLWYFLLLGIFEIMLISKKREYCFAHPGLSYDKTYDYRAELFFSILVFLPLFFIAGFRDWWYADTTAYVSMFKSWPNSLSGISLTGEERYPGFIYFTVFIKQFISTDYRPWLLIIAGISIICLVLTYRRYTSEIVLCAFLFFASTDFQSWMMNGMRQFLVVAVMVAFIPMLFKKRISYLILFVLIGLLLYTIHVSVIVAIPMYILALGKPMNKKTLSVMVLALLAVIFVDQFTDIFTETVSNTTYSSSAGEMTNAEGDDGTNVLRVLVYSVPALLAIVFRKKIPDDAPEIISFSINMSLIAMAFYVLSIAVRSGIFFGRVPIYFSLFNYILLPWEINTFFNIKNRQAVYIAMIVLYILFNLIQHSLWGF